MNSIKRQYFLAYGVMGSSMPFLPVFLKHKGLSQTQIGSALALASVAVLLSPVLLSLLADKQFDSRRIMSIVLCIGAAALAALGVAQSFGAILVLLCLQSLAYVAILPLLDALNFGWLQRHIESGKTPIPYERIRVWGTMGFIVPGALLFLALFNGGGMSWILVSGAAFSLLGALNARTLPSPLETQNASIETTVSTRLPTGEAARALGRRPVLVFCCVMFLAGMASSAFYGFYPLYLTEVVGVREYWIAPINNIGVVFEIGFMLAFGPLLARLGFKRLILLGLSCLALRFALLAAMPIPIVAVGTQIIHGMIVITTTVAPVTYLNRQAGETFRNSIQGLYTMAFAGSSRVIGSYLSGQVAQHSLVWLFAGAATLACVSIVLLFFAFEDEAIEV